MKKTKCLITVALIAAMITGLAGCKTTSTQGKNDNGGSSTALKNANFTFLAQDQEETLRDPAKNLTWATAIKNYEQKYNAKITIVYSPYAEKQGKLSAMMAAGNPPDLYSPINGYPQFAVNGFAQPIDDLINLKDPIWKDLKGAYDQMEWKGKHNFVVTSQAPTGVLWYNKTIFENNGLETPYDLYKAGNWNWSTFRDAAIKLTQDTDGDKVIDQWGYSAGGPEEMTPTTGKDYVKIDGKNGAITNNLKDTDIINVLTFFQESGPAKYNIIQPEQNAYQTDFAKGKIAMLFAATWGDTVWFPDLMKKGQVSFVPAPKYTGANDYYVRGNPEYYMIPKGCPNPQAAAAFLAELRKVEMQPADQKKADEDNAKRGWGAKEVEMNNELNKLKYTFLFFQGVGNITNDRFGLWNELRVQGVPVQTAIEKHNPVWQNEIDILTGKVKLVHNEYNATSGTPKIDGEIDDIWKNAQEIQTTGQKKPDDAATAKVKVLYDADTLYVLAQVSDPKVMSDNKNAYECDSIEFFVDENNVKATSYDGNTFQLRVGADGKLTGAGTDWDKRKADLTGAAKKVDGGYIIEAAYKFKSIKAKSGASIGFNVGVNDERETGKKYGTSIWNPDDGNSYNSPNRFGIVNFK